MPRRKLPLVNNHIYHVYNRGIDRAPTFHSKRDYARAIASLEYFTFNQPLSFSHYLKTSNLQRQHYQQPTPNSPRVTILAYCLMPNHFHLLLQQQSSNGISDFLRDFQSSYTQYHNQRIQRDGGPLFSTQFKAVLIETPEQLQHVARYIHLNPYTSALVKSPTEILSYAWSSMEKYTEANSTIKVPSIYIDTTTVLSSWKRAADYVQFTLDQADYQKDLHLIKHLTIE